jgi:hypothetical protein
MDAPSWRLVSHSWRLVSHMPFSAVCALLSVPFYSVSMAFRRTLYGEPANACLACLKDGEVAPELVALRPPPNAHGLLLVLIGFAGFGIFGVQAALRIPGALRDGEICAFAMDTTTHTTPYRGRSPDPGKGKGLL